ncbi:hypothetical protein GGX14DRAFT_431517 [Mycena pura]|uniref:Uncharacterized protein n=1 Tax=Mycena pura TaxID=153505 RepID=A0AAD6VUD1_9AGAR|nr:hypothetical protein GGX14DRAFT_431517 [Mycena pura]
MQYIRQSQELKPTTQSSIQMSSVVTLSLILAHAVAAMANPVARAACNPSLAGSGVSIASGSLELGYSSSVAGAVIISQPLSATSPEFIAEATTVSNGGFLLKDSNQDNHAAGLFCTNVNGSLELETAVSPEDGTQGWGFVCSTCNAVTTGLIASGCNVVSGFSGKCLQIGSAVGDAVAIATCSDLGAGPQYFDVYVG